MVRMVIHGNDKEEKLPFLVSMDQEFQSSWTGRSVSGSLLRAQAMLTAVQ